MKLWFKYFYRYIFLLWLFLLCLSCTNSAQNTDASKSEKLPHNQEVTVFLVVYGEEVKPESLPPNCIKFGCNDYLVPVSVPLLDSEKAGLRTALNKLLSTKGHKMGSLNLVNVWNRFETYVKMDSVYQRNDTTIVEISGKIYSSGVCEDPRTAGQIEETIKQYASKYLIKFNGSEKNWIKLFDMSGE